MEITLNFEFVNWWAVLAATIAVFLIGGAWYSPALFGRFLDRDKANTDSDRNIAVLFFVAFVLQWLSASMMAAVLGPNSTAIYGLQVGLLVGSFFVATSLGITRIFENRPMKLLFISGGYHIVCFGTMGLIIGSLH